MHAFPWWFDFLMNALFVLLSWQTWVVIGVLVVELFGHARDFGRLVEGGKERPSRASEERRNENISEMKKRIGPSMQSAS